MWGLSVFEFSVQAWCIVAFVNINALLYITFLFLKCFHTYAVTLFIRPEKDTEHQIEEI